MKQVNRLAATLVLAVVTTTVLAQTPTPTPAPTPARTLGSIASHPDWPKAKPEDVSSPEAILKAVYDVISGGKNQPRDWDRFRSLFVPDAHLIPTVTPPAAAGATPHTDAIFLTPDGYVARSSARLTSDGFFEHSIHNETEQFGNIVQIWSTYESRHDPADVKPFARGINSFQLLKDGDRYWVVNIFWDAETPTKPIPAKYLP